MSSFRRHIPTSICDGSDLTRKRCPLQLLIGDALMARTVAEKTFAETDEGSTEVYDLMSLSFANNRLDDLEKGGFGGDLYAISEMRPSEPSDPIQTAALFKMEEDERINALIETSTLKLKR